MEINYEEYKQNQENQKQAAAKIAAMPPVIRKPRKRCRKCGHYEGDVNFTTGGGGDVCDDCF